MTLLFQPRDPSTDAQLTYALSRSLKESGTHDRYGSETESHDGARCDSSPVNFGRELVRIIGIIPAGPVAPIHPQEILGNSDGIPSAQ
jgi:hypothetical protein